jgi:plastocyanin
MLEQNGKKKKKRVFLTSWTLFRCCNIGVFDPFSNSVYCNNADSHQYRWDLKNNVIAERVYMGSALLEAYTPSVIGPDGAIYAINMGVMVGFFCPNVTTTIATSTVPTSTTVSEVTTTAPSASCGVVNIALLGGSFQPNNITVRAGDLIQFVWISGFHYVQDITSEVDPISCGGNPSTALFVSSASSSTGTVFRVATGGLAPGTYRFVCPVHCFSMRGFFIVAGRCDCAAQPDIFQDAQISILDVAAVNDNFGPCRSGACISSDLNCDGVVNSSDTEALLSAWTSQKK